MPAVGRRRTKDQHLPLGVRPIGERLFWQPPTARERKDRKDKGLPASVPLGAILRVRGRIELTKAQRTRWAEVSGYRDETDAAGTIGELLKTFYDDGHVLKRRNGKPRAADTVKQYRARRRILTEALGACRYGRTESEVLQGRGASVGIIQGFVTSAGSVGRAYLAILKHSFDLAILNGKTTYNPCDKVVPPPINARTKEPQEWELEVLCAMALPVIGLILETKAISGYRISELLRILRSDFVPEGIRVLCKGGKRELLEWSPRLHAIDAAAALVPHASPFGASPLFPSSKGKAYTYRGWYTAWRDLLMATNKALRDCGVLDAEDLEPWHPALQILDLNVHDFRSKVHDDAEARGRKGHEQIGNTPRVARKHYARREKRRTPLE